MTPVQRQNGQPLQKQNNRVTKQIFYYLIVFDVFHINQTINCD